ncbi:ABC transporter ATP-binding protein [Ammoniphilus sp. YIM 78166]|uniref:ABC transporter ATP-binding protein n=1 Tax=Ammoniphilus sp. YIM 78166 TaxID=1644106 RepID=UPI0010705A66|nr:ATP-binding cassette domain-containing protein [Ammoniphilus sp. YIM 78166]
MTEPMILVNHLSKKYGEIQAVHDVSFFVERGECFGLLGPNGAGKSTTIKMLTTLADMDEGQVLIGGFDLQLDPMSIRRLIGYVPQAISVDGTLTGYENLLLFAKLYGLPKKDRLERIQEVTELLDLAEVANRQAKSYSGGMIRRLEIGQAILHKPKVLFLDEPTVGLDPVARQSVWSHLEALRANEKMTIIMTTHYMEEAESMCSNIAIMSKGCIAARGTLQELQAQAGKPEASMNEIFVHFAGSPDQQGGMKDVYRSRRTAKRLG